MRRSSRIKEKVEQKVKSPKIKTAKKKATKAKDEVANLNSSNLLSQIKKAGRNPDVQVSPENEEKRISLVSTLSELKKLKTEQESGKERVKQTRKPKKEENEDVSKVDLVKETSEIVKEDQDVTTEESGIHSDESKEEIDSDTKQNCKESQTSVKVNCNVKKEKVKRSQKQKKEELNVETSHENENDGNDENKQCDDINDNARQQLPSTAQTSIKASVRKSRRKPKEKEPDDIDVQAKGENNDQCNKGNKVEIDECVNLADVAKSRVKASTKKEKRTRKKVELDDNEGMTIDMKDGIESKKIDDEVVDNIEIETFKEIQDNGDPTRNKGSTKSKRKLRKKVPEEKDIQATEEGEEENATMSDEVSKAIQSDNAPTTTEETIDSKVIIEESTEEIISIKDEEKKGNEFNDEEEEMETAVRDDDTDVVIKVSNDDIDERSTVDFNIMSEKVALVPEVLSDEDSSSGSSLNEEKTSDSPVIPSSTTNGINEDQKKVLKFDLDRSKYISGENKFSSNPLMQTLSSLKKSFPFKDYILNNKKKDNYDVLCLDSVSLTKNSPMFKADLSKLSSQVQAPKQPELYFDCSGSQKSKSKLDRKVENLMKKSSLSHGLEGMEKAPKLHVSKHLVKADSKKKSEETAGKGWYNLPKTEITESIKKDLQIIKMRGALDPKKHYKRNDSNKFPKYFQMGTVVEGAHEFYSSRVPQGKRKKNMVDELLEDAEFRRKNKKQFLELRKKQMSGGKRFYKQLKNKKKETWERT